MKTITKLIAAAFVFFSVHSYGQWACYPTAIADLDTNNVRALLMNGSDKWWDTSGGVPKYEIPKGSGKHSMYAAALWIGGYDASGILHVAAQTYRQTGNDFWAGPIQKSNCVISADTINCQNYQHIWGFKKSEISNFISTGTATNDISTYPANGNTANGELPVLAPFFDVNSNGQYEPSIGDYPLMDINNNIPDSVEQLFGDQCLYWIFNDTAGVNYDNSPPLGIEVHAQAFSIASSIPAINNTTFYRYKLINRSCLTYDSVFISHFTDPDLGYYQDDFAGCHIGKNLGYCYNGDAVDDLPDGYGPTPPAIGVSVLQGPLVDANDGIDNNNNGTTDEPGEENLMTSFLVYNNSSNPLNGNPMNKQEYYNYMSGKWRNGMPWTYGGNGTAGGTNATNFIYPGNSDSTYFSSLGQWDEILAGNTPDDRRFLVSSGPFTFHPDQCVCITYAVVWARAASGNNLASVDSLFSATDYIRNNFRFYDCPCNTPVGINQNSQAPAAFDIYPNPATDEIVINSKQAAIDKIEITNILGEKVYDKELHTFNYKLSTVNFSAGIYIMKAYTEKGIYEEKMLINH